MQLLQPGVGCPSAGSRHGLRGLPESSTAGCFPAAIAPTAGPALSTSAAHATICRHPRQKGHPQEETRASRPPDAEGRGGWAKPALGEPPAPERRRSLTRRSHEQAASGASQRHRSPPPRPAASTRPASAVRRARSGAPARGDRARTRRRFPTGETRLLRNLAACWVPPLPTRTRGFGFAFAWVQLHGC
ncbi:potassium/sodium hyperpolarization-activated cyclic nucleotide-gated channel 2-like [Melospiza georgiana]|uniref:potassium/sodium hyperpolarization-activated cyclic nucleotide-gated channel 2-like n=1 Tax=Melospiza georgiana TaxID=44398 RepID=UPI0025AC2C51|nr:potassium/sodium hyperpolarization-activated cyclic nucleotide-gated channel 2-like [Melospiza georgiana]